MNRRRGSAAAEFLAVSGLFVGLAAGTVEFGWYFSQRARVAVAVAEGTKAGATVLESPHVAYGTQIRAVAEALHEQAHTRCYIANSVTFPITIEPVIVVEP